MSTTRNHHWLAETGVNLAKVLLLGGVLPVALVGLIAAAL